MKNSESLRSRIIFTSRAALYKFATFETTFIKCWTVTPNNFFGQDTKEKLCHVTVRHFSAMKFSRIKPYWYWSNLWLSITNRSEQKRTEANTYLVDINSWTLFAIVDQLANIQSVLSQFFESMSHRLRHVNRNKVSHQSYREKRSKPNLKMCCSKWICHL